MKQTAVEFLLEQIKKDSNLRLRGFDIDGIGNKAKEMEKQQIIDAQENGQSIYSDVIKCDKSIRYYNETFSESTPWYDEDKAIERMNVIGQNGNDGEHY